MVLIMSAPRLSKAEHVCAWRWGLGAVRVLFFYCYFFPALLQELFFFSPSRLSLCLLQLDGHLTCKIFLIKYKIIGLDSNSFIHFSSGRNLASSGLVTQPALLPFNFRALMLRIRSLPQLVYQLSALATVMNYWPVGDSLTLDQYAKVLKKKS